MSSSSHHPRNSSRPGGYYQSSNQQRPRRQGYSGHYRSNGRGRPELPPLIPIPSHRRTSSTHSSLSSSSGTSLSSRFSSYEDQQKYIDSFEATLASDNPFNQSSGSGVVFEESYGSASVPTQPPFYTYPPPPSKTLRLIQQIRKYDVEKLQTLKGISLEALSNDDNDEEWLSQMTVDVFRPQSAPRDDHLFPDEPFSLASSSSSSEEGLDDNYEFNHHINSLLDIISS